MCSLQRERDREREDKSINYLIRTELAQSIPIDIWFNLNKNGSWLIHKRVPGWEQSSFWKLLLLKIVRSKQYFWKMSSLVKKLKNSFSQKLEKGLSCWAQACQLFGTIAASALACVGERFPKRGCIWWP